LFVFGFSSERAHHVIFSLSLTLSSLSSPSFSFFSLESLALKIIIIRGGGFRVSAQVDRRRHARLRRLRRSRQRRRRRRPGRDAGIDDDCRGVALHLGEGVDGVLGRRGSADVGCRGDAGEAPAFPHHVNFFRVGATAVAEHPNFAIFRFLHLTTVAFVHVFLFIILLVMIMILSPCGARALANDVFDFGM